MKKINIVSKISKKAGLPPGTLIHVGKKKTDKIRISQMSYDENSFDMSQVENIEKCNPKSGKSNVNWLNIDGLHDIAVLEQVGRNFGLHPLLLEDVLNTDHRPKIEEFGDWLLLSLKMLNINEKDNQLQSEQISIVLGKNWVISFQEEEGDIFDGLRHRIKEAKGNIRLKSADYLMYRLIDTIVDYYFLIIEHITDQTLKLEEKVTLDTDKEALHEIQHLKKLLINVAKAVSPLKETIATLEEDGGDFINDDTKPFLHDVYEHVVQVNESVASLRDTLSTIMDLYLSGLSNKTNQVMQVLTIIATIFIPLTFIAGVYGMNFDNMPELHFRYGYFGVWGIMLTVLVIMIIYFRRKRWL